MIKEKHLAKGYKTGKVLTDRGPSASIWKDCPILDFDNNPLVGQHYFEDFKFGAYTLDTNQALTKLADGVYGFTGNDASNTIATVTTTVIGEIQLNTGVSNVGTTLLMMCQTGAGGLIELPVNKKFWYEIRLKSDVAANDKRGMFVGIADKALGTAEALINTSGALTDVNYLGFLNKEDDFDTIDCVWKNKGVTASTEVAGGDAKGVLATSTYTKLGIKGDGKGLTFYQDGSIIYKTSASVHAATSFPNVATENMCLVVATMGAATQAVVDTIDWVKFAQEY